MNLAELFPAGGFRFRAGLRRGDPAEFFGPTDQTGEVRPERARWLAEDERRHAALLPEGEVLLKAFSGLCSSWGVSRETELGALGSAIEPDFLFLAPDGTGTFRLLGGVVCFPSGWALDEKLGRPMCEIHEPVPGLNRNLGVSIDRILSGLPGDSGVFRSGWGIAANAERNQHPVRGLPAPTSPADLRQLWLRVENQCLFAIPERGIVFGIRIELHRLDAAAGTALADAMETMPLEVAAYKRLDSVRDLLVESLRSRFGI
jgi:hypothetical protein